MKTTLRVTSAAAALLAAALTVSGCSVDTPSTPTNGGGSGGTFVDVPYDGPEADLPESYPTPATLPKGDFTVGYMNIYAAIPLLAAEQDAAQKTVEQYGGTFLTKDDQLDVTTQVNHCNEFIAQGVDAILLYPLDPASLQPCFDAAAAAGIAVIPQNTPVAADQTSILTTDVIQGFDKAAYLRAQAVAKAAPGSSYALIGLAAPVAALTYYTERTKYWADKFGLVYVDRVDAQTDNAQGASTAISALLAKHADVKTVFAYNDPTAVAASTTARGSGRTDLYIIGSDGTTAAFAAIKDGSMFGTIWKDPVVIGTNQATAAVTLIGDPKATLPEFVTTPGVFIDSSNADDYTPVG